jgi:hypothetical protein
LSNSSSVYYSDKVTNNAPFKTTLYCAFVYPIRVTFSFAVKRAISITFSGAVGNTRFPLIHAKFSASGALFGALSETFNYPSNL